MNIQNTASFNLEHFMEVRKAAQMRMTQTGTTGSVSGSSAVSENGVVDFTRIIEQLKAAKTRTEATPAVSRPNRPQAPQRMLRTDKADSVSGLLNAYGPKQVLSTDKIGEVDALANTRHLGTLFDKVA
ncbi:MAG: hypothetical protein A2293_00810 [Elusimicrobia bacterium RIFOXYB2_FULL_49_7]|nr:MAG: hypothetical protein A2293_00810 [Elusimicrobia bacterium RIFOXYB2_FULL_49_7]